MLIKFLFGVKKLATVGKQTLEGYCRIFGFGLDMAWLVWRHFRWALRSGFKSFI